MHPSLLCRPCTSSIPALPTRFGKWCSPRRQLLSCFCGSESSLMLLAAAERPWSDILYSDHITHLTLMLAALAFAAGIARSSTQSKRSSKKMHQPTPTCVHEAHHKPVSRQLAEKRGQAGMYKAESTKSEACPRLCKNSRPSPETLTRRSDCWTHAALTESLPTCCRGVPHLYAIYKAEP